ncbi:MAG TPA: glycosyltransferase family 2 protein [Bryobacteraceae bacterium]|nr:glycosyltransferase family 2 protein [Bryobacteraceae bacterium]
MKRTERSADPDCTLLLPENDAIRPEFSIVLPAMNERLTIGDTIEWCKEGFRTAGVSGEILIVDSSSDDTAQIALAHGARVLKTPKRGLGRAYIDSIPYIRANNILMGDADCTYDFREISQFVRAFGKGFEFIMGSRFRGYIEEGAMPGLHRHFGTPLTTAILNFLYASHFSDIHCGMRGITKPALQRIQLESQSWEYASEMVLKSACMSLRTTEVPVRFLKDREGRSSHMKRGGMLEPWRAGWINLRAMFIYHADFFVLRPGLIALVLGLLLSLPQTFGPVKVGSVTLSLYWMLFGMTLAVTGLQSFYLGCIVQVMYNYSDEVRQRWLNFFSYTRALAVSGLFALVGLSLALPLVQIYVRNGLALPDTIGKANHEAVIGLLFLISSFMTFSSTLVLHAASLRGRR